MSLDAVLSEWFVANVSTVSAEIGGIVILAHKLLMSFN